jgi:putative glycosyltransferase (TIGR04372 family)
MKQDKRTGYHLLHAINAFGHIMIEPFFLLNPGPDDPKKIVILYPDDRQPSNPAVLKIIQRYFTVSSLPTEKFHLLMSGKLSLNDQEGQPLIRMPWVDFALDRWAEKLLRGDFARPRFLELSDEEIDEGKRIQESIGLGADEPFVCIHNREAGYHPQITNQAYRDSSISSFIPAIRYLLQKNFRVVRLGDSSMTPLPAMPGLIDLTRKRDKHPLTDIWLGTRCAFMVGSPSGPLVIPTVFNGPPLLCVNLVDHPSYPVNVMSRYILKPIRILHQGGRLLNFNERMLVMRHHPRDMNFQQFGFDIIPNSEDEILEAVEEMTEDIKKGSGVDRTTALQMTFWETAKRWHDLYGVSRSYEPYHVFSMPLSNRYLERYAHLMIEESLFQGEELFRAGKLEEAQEFFEKIVKANPAHFTAANNLGTILYTRGDIAAAEKAYLRAFSLKSDDDDILANIIDLYLNLKRWKDAVFFLELYLTPGRCDLIRMNQLALAHMELGAPHKALPILIRSLETEPGQESIRDLLLTLQPEAPIIHSPSMLAPAQMASNTRPDDGP